MRDDEDEVLAELHADLSFGECPACGLPCQHLASGPQGFPWHDCDWVLSSRKAQAPTKDPLESMLGAVAAAVTEKARDIPGQYLAAILEGTAAVLKAKGTGEGGDIQQLLEYLRNEIDEGDPLEGLGGGNAQVPHDTVAEDGADPASA